MKKLFVLWFAFSCFYTGWGQENAPFPKKQNKKASKISYTKINPPGTVKISPNFYGDKSYLTNLDWLEYMTWTKKIFGEDYPEIYQATLPDTTILKIITDSLKLKCDYLSHPAYRMYPVFGISKTQAENYAKWRTDRVIEYALIKEKVLKRDTAPENYFSVERYYTSLTPHSVEKPAFFPVYTLPTSVEKSQLPTVSPKSQTLFDSIYGILKNSMDNFEYQGFRFVCKLDYFKESESK